VFIRQRKVRRSSKFSSRWSRTSLQRREYTASLYTTSLIQFLLFWALVFGTYQTAVMMHAQFPESALYVRYALPIVMGAVALVVLRAFVRNLRQAIELYRRATSALRDEDARPHGTDTP
jgi:TRAP-type C4-dicarboxylate transport system permease small subunit